MQLFRKSNKLRIMCNSPGIMTFSPYQNISPRSGSSEMDLVTCQNGYRPFPQLFAYFAWRGVINHDRMITLTLQTKYDTILPSGYPKFAYPLEISFWIRSLFTHGQTLPGRFAIGSETIGCRFGVVYRDVTTGSRESRVHHYDAPSFTEFWNLYCPRTMHFS